MTEPDSVWMCPQCGTTWSDEARGRLGNKCDLGHEPRSLVCHHPKLDVDILLDLAPKVSGDGIPEKIKRLRKDYEVPKELRDPPPVVETDEGEYDFGFGRPAVSAAEDGEWQQLYGGRLQKPVSEVMNEVDLMARTIRVLLDKMGGNVDLNPSEVMYIMMSRNKPIPNISREQTTWGGRVILRIENDE
jgi:hypothetical protein